MGSLPVMVTAPDLAAALSYEQWLALPEDRARHAELLDGRLVAKFPTVEIGEAAVVTPGRRHQQLVLALGAAIRAWAREAGGRGEVTLEPPVRIADDRAYLPDLAWYPEVPAGAEQYDGVPALVVEVLSPTTRAFDVLRKTADYAKAGVEELWLVDPAGPTAQVYRRVEGLGQYRFVDELGVDGVLESPLLPTLRIRLDELA